MATQCVNTIVGLAWCACASALAQSAVQFTDVTAGSGLDSFSHSPNPGSVPGLNEWIMGGFGVADFNGDGWPDIFVPRGGVGLDRLFINNGNGTFGNQAAKRGVAVAHAGNGVSCADFDGDGDIDIFMTSYGSGSDNLGQVGRNRLYRNDGAFFSEIAASAGVAFTSTTVSAGDGAAWGDIDLDGDLDLVVCAWSGTTLGNRMFRNDGGVFVDVTDSAIVFHTMWGFQPLIVDVTGDGFPEVLIAADFQTSRAYRNLRNGTFALATAELGMGVDDNGMGICVGDFDRNRAIDTYVTSLHTETPADGAFTGNALYMNRGDGVTTEDSAARGCNDGGWGWGAVAGDFDHDGWEDIAEVNGRNGGEWANEQEYIYRNTGGGRFERLGAETGIALAADARCVGTIDFDRDGDLDLVVLVNSGPLRLYRNDSPKSGRWLEVDLAAGAESRCAPQGMGAVVECQVGGVTYRRWMHSGSGYHSSSEPVVHFGLPTAEASCLVRVLWPSGQTSELTGVALDSRVRIAAPARCDLNADGAANAVDLAQLMSEWGATDRSSRAMRRADVDGDGFVGPRDVAALLAAWSG